MNVTPEHFETLLTVIKTISVCKNPPHSARKTANLEQICFSATGICKTLLKVQ